MSVWRSIGTTFGTSPPPSRPLYPAGNPGLKTWTLQRAVTTFTGGGVIDSGWTDPFDGFTWPAGGLAIDGAGGQTMVISILSVGRRMPWQIVIRDKITVIATGAVSYNDYTTDITPGVQVDFNYTASAGTRREAWTHYINVPAEGV